MSEAGEPPAERGFLSTLAGVYAAPGEAFRAVAARPRWEAPLLLAIAIGLAFTAVWISKVDPVEFMRAQMEESGGMERIPPERRADVLQGQAKWFKAFAWVGPVFFAPLGLAAMAGVFLFVYRFFYEAELTFAQSLAVVTWCFAAFGLLMDPLILLVMAMKNEWSVDPHSVIQASAAALLDKSTTSKPLYALAGSLDIFSVWLIALLSIGYGAAMRKPASSAVWAIVAIWGAYVMGKVALSAIF